MNTPTVSRANLELNIGSSIYTLNYTLYTGFECVPTSFISLAELYKYAQTLKDCGDVYKYIIAHKINLCTGKREIIFTFSRD